MKNSLLNNIKEYIVEKLEDLEGVEKYITDIPSLLTECQNINCSWYCSSYKAKEDLKEHFGDVQNFVEFYVDEFGERPPFDVFLEPEKFHCMIMIYAVENVFYQCNTINFNWNKTVRVDNEFIENIKNDLLDISKVFV